MRGGTVRTFARPNVSLLAHGLRYVRPRAEAALSNDGRHPHERVYPPRLSHRAARSSSSSSVVHSCLGLIPGQGKAGAGRGERGKPAGEWEDGNELGRNPQRLIACANTCQGEKYVRISHSNVSCPTPALSSKCSRCDGEATGEGMQQGGSGHVRAAAPRPRRGVRCSGLALTTIVRNLHPESKHRRVCARLRIQGAERRRTDGDRSVFRA
jgi:hypothetical protein